MRVVPAQFMQLVYVVEHLRDLDRRELAAMQCDLRSLPGHIISKNIFAFCALDRRNVPVAAWGMLEQRKGVGAGFAFGTDRWGKALPTIVHNMRGFVLPFLASNGYHRVECAALAHRHDVRRFLALIGAKPEATMQQSGINGEDFVLYRWLADEYVSARSGDRHVSHHGKAGNGGRHPAAA
jgi:hypothetical protein